MNQCKARILVVDDHALVREMLQERLNQEPDLEVVGIVENGAEALEVSESLKPDLVLLDIDMPGPSAFETAQQITAKLPRSRVLFLSGYVQDAYIAQAVGPQNLSAQKMNELDSIWITGNGARAYLKLLGSSGTL